MAPCRLPDRLCYALLVGQSIWRLLDIRYSTAVEETSTKPAASYERLPMLVRIANHSLPYYLIDCASLLLLINFAYCLIMQYITLDITNMAIDKTMSDHRGSTLRRSNVLIPKGERFPAKRKATNAIIQLFMFVFMPSMQQHPCQQHLSGEIRAPRPLTAQYFTNRSIFSRREQDVQRDLCFER